MNVKYLINRAVREYPDKAAIAYDGVRRTFQELDKRVNALANGLLEMGVRKGDRVGMLLTNCPEFIEIDFALSKTGIVRVPLNSRLTGADHRYMLDDSEADLLIFGEGFTDVVKTIRPCLKTVKRFITVSEGLSRENIPEAIKKISIPSSTHRGLPESPKGPCCLRSHGQTLPLILSWTMDRLPRTM
jgi:acyl-CoA synthetase (AMP-forming)/AMP-acid ligase II